ncbi:metallophosphoesterase [Lutibacter sp. TH_r2]|uniref:metallophosphoesterase n=1 Tax=Lutibacter sp. TH_r2 TaxID=3082083 RepID=UPI0029542A6E|nr:metallophosphoesterase [Lutibacter sp. TH_r2]MDV7186152.1 metallophosphoesterase [Lutibacter sp. TH_r2]
MLRLFIFTSVILLIDFYAFQSVRTLTKNKWIYLVYWLISIGVIANLFFQFSQRDTHGISQRVMFAIGLFILLGVPKIVMAFSMLAEDIIRIIKSVFNLMSSSDATFIPSRRAFVSKVALGLAAIPFASTIYGMMRGKYNYQVVKHTLFFNDLPEAFDGFKITHLSDIHSGSFDNPEKISYGIDLINEQESDVVLFTGDLVNNIADEMDNWIPYFNRIQAKEGKYSVLGNHDYGEYVRWNNSEEKEQNFQAIKDIHPKIGFDLLLNESRYLKKNGEKIALVGVENWGTRFKKAGDLKKASENIKKEDFKILMSHDPSHWESEVKKHEDNYHLTLSGHTHGMQFGIEIPGIKWSPVQYIYKHWAGIYKEYNRYINVNRGFGFLAFPGRVGIWPEISVITLKKMKD